jgi:hypothetical protein
VTVSAEDETGLRTSKSGLDLFSGLNARENAGAASSVVEKSEREPR